MSHPPELISNKEMSGLNNELTSDNNKMDTMEFVENLPKSRLGTSPRRSSPLRRQANSAASSPQRNLPHSDSDDKGHPTTLVPQPMLSPRKNSFLQQALSPRKSPRPERFKAGHEADPKMSPLRDSKEPLREENNGLVSGGSISKKDTTATGNREDTAVIDSEKTKKRTLKTGGLELEGDQGSNHSTSDSLPHKKKRTKSMSKESSAGRATQNGESDVSDAELEAEKSDKKSGKNKNGPLDYIPQDIRFDPKSLENKPKGLVDALSPFFSPGLKRTSRTAMNSLLKPETRSEEKEPSKKVRLSVDEKELQHREDNSVITDRKRHASSGQQQVKSLYDGLSHLYTDCDSRLRSVPMTNYSEKQGQVASSAAGVSGEQKAGQSPERIASPHRMSDSEMKEKAESNLKKLKEKGNSKDRINISMFFFVVDYCF